MIHIVQRSSARFGRTLLRLFYATPSIHKGKHA